MKTQIKTLLLAATAFVGLASNATSPASESPVLAKITQSSGYFHAEPRGKRFVGMDIILTEDGKVTVSRRYSLRNRLIEETSQPLSYKVEDMLRFKKSITQLKLDRPLVEDTSEGIICDGGVTQFIVVINGQEVLLEQHNDCTANRIRDGRSPLEVQVINVLKDLLEAYYKIQR